MKTPTPKMFKGSTKHVWEATLINSGWPQPLAGLMAAFLTGEGPLPMWPLGFDLLHNRRIIEP